MCAILEREPTPIASLQPLTPPALARFVGKCLAKDAEVRWQSAVDAADELRWLIGGSTGGAQATRRRLPLGVAAVLGVVLLAAALGVAFLLRPASERAPSAPPSLRLNITLPDDKPLAPAGRVWPGHDKPALALSPDGSRLAYVALISGKTQLCVRDMRSGQVAPLEGTFGGNTPFFSPDGDWIGFFADNKLKKIPLAAGRVTALADAPNGWGGSWGSDGFIYFNRYEGEGVFRVSNAGGAVDRVCDGLMPETVESGRGLLVQAGGVNYVTLGTDAPVRRVATGNRARYLSGGHLLYSVGSTVMARRFDPEKATAEGEGVQLCDDVRSANYSVAQFTVSESGTFVYVPGRPQGLTSFAWVDRTGRMETVGLPESEAQYTNYALSPDGTRLAYSLDGEIFVWDRARRTTASRLTPRAPSGVQMRSMCPRWTRDGKSILYQATSAGTSTRLMAASVDGSPPVQVWATESRLAYPMGFSPDGGTLSLFTVGRKSSFDMWLMQRGSSGRSAGSEPQLFLGTPFGECFGWISADGRWMLFSSDVSGQYEIWATTYPEAGPMFQLSDNGGREAMWNPAVPTEVVYLNGTAMYAVDVSRGPANPGKPQLLFDGPYPDTSGFGYDMGPDGRFLMLQNPDILKPATTLTVITNVFEELKAKVPPAR
jgi:serine/threonine-protein kinase